MRDSFQESYRHVSLRSEIAVDDCAQNSEGSTLSKVRHVDRILSMMKAADHAFRYPHSFTCWRK